MPVLRSYITTTSKHADTCQRKARVDVCPALFPFSISRCLDKTFLSLLFLPLPELVSSRWTVHRRVEYLGIVPNAGYLYEDCCARSKYEVNDSPRVTSFFYAESFLHFLAFFFLSLRQFGISNENSDPRFVIRVEGMKGFKLGFVAIQSDFLHVVFLSFIKG